jgi:hypothetical protein
MRETRDSRRYYSIRLSSLRPKKRDFPHLFSWVEIIMILDPIRLRFLFLVPIYDIQEKEIE